MLRQHSISLNKLVTVAFSWDFPTNCTKIQVQLAECTRISFRVENLVILWYFNGRKSLGVYRCKQKVSTHRAASSMGETPSQLDSVDHIISLPPLTAVLARRHEIAFLVTAFLTTVVKDSPLLLIKRSQFPGWVMSKQMA